MKTNKPFKYTSKDAKQSDLEFSDVLKHNDYARLRAQWYSKLKRSGFQDLEDKHGNVKTPDTRTVAWANQDRIRDFFLRLDAYLTKTKDLPPIHRKILEMYTRGIRRTEIIKSTGYSRTYVRDVISFYKRKILKAYWGPEEFKRVFKQK